MKERPILFSGEMVRAILDGRKKQTRRVIKPQPSMEQSCEPEGYSWIPAWKGRELSPTQCPYGQPGDRLWVRETWFSPEKGIAAYKAYGEKKPNPPGQIGFYYPGPIKWKPSIHMPRWASRITLEVVNVRVERLQDITAHDALAEGIDTRGLYLGNPDYDHIARHTAIGLFRSLWDSINVSRGFGWDVNPWIWVVEFKKFEE